MPFYDSRERIVNRYRVEFVPGQQLRLVWLEQNAGSQWIKATWAIAGLFLAVAVGGGGWGIRKLSRSIAKKTTV